MITAKEAAKRIKESFGLNEFDSQNVRNWIKTGKLSGKKILGKYYVNTSDLESYLNANTQEFN